MDSDFVSVRGAFLACCIIATAALLLGIALGETEAQDHCQYALRMVAKWAR